MIQDNGILRRVPGGYCAAASATLPPVETAEDRPHDVVIDAGHVGWVRIYFRRMRVRHHKHSHLVLASVSGRAGRHANATSLLTR